MRKTKNGRFPMRGACGVCRPSNIAKTLDNLLTLEHVHSPPSIFAEDQPQTCSCCISLQRLEVWERASHAAADGCAKSWGHRRRIFRGTVRYC
ncbi:hypothetical protein J1614_011115 [Plenodomus biglobosus]|nr:hypothetical protein J1614_011115 [Plenodomus biglobosus]